MVSYKNCNISSNEGFIIFLTSKSPIQLKTSCHLYFFVTLRLPCSCKCHDPFSLGSLVYLHALLTISPQK